MSNMSYCRFRNTLSDLRDCYIYFDDDELCEEEKIAKEKLVKLCRKICDAEDENL